MARIFSQHKIRRTANLPDTWDFSAAGKTLKMHVPGCWETIPEFSNYRGKALYETEFFGKGYMRIVFNGVSHTAKISLDGEMMAEHYGAYSAFDFVSEKLEAGMHQLVADVDNSFHKDSALHIPGNDYYSYGGITRPVELEFIENGIYISAFRMTPVYTDKGWRGRSVVSIKNLEDKKRDITLSLEIAGKKTLMPVEIDAKEEQAVFFEESYENAETYTLSDPKLYFAELVLYENGEAIDDLIDRVGFRTVEIKGDKIYFAGEELKLKGFNRHEDYAEYGCAIPLSVMARDIAIIKEANANCIRTSHYPNDDRFIDLCDENGILVWEEAHARALLEENMRHPKFMEQSLLSIREMIGQHFNHPCIFTWGMLNECASDTEFGRECYKVLIAEIKKLDPSRPSTFATFKYGVHGNDICLDLPDIVSYNIFPGWYLKVPTGEHIAGLKKFIDTTPGAGKPIIISEIGAGGIYGFRSDVKPKWSEDRQAELVAEQIEGVLKDHDFVGVLIWQFADCRVDEDIFASRPKTQNNKGIVDTYRRKKLAFTAVRDIFGKY